MASGSAKKPVVEGSQVLLSSADKALWPEPGSTKADLARYYAASRRGCCRS